MALGPGAALRVRREAEVCQAPSRSSALLHVVQAGRLVKQLADAVDLPDVGRRVPLVPRGWIDADAVEPAGEGDGAGPRQPCAGAVAAAAPPAGSGEELLRRLGDGRRPFRRLAPDGEAAARSGAEAPAPAEDRAEQEAGSQAEPGGGWWGSSRDSQPGGDWWESSDHWAESSRARKDDRWQEGWAEDEGTKAETAPDTWWKSDHQQDEQWQETPSQKVSGAQHQAPARNPWKHKASVSSGWQASSASCEGLEGRPPALLFSGSVARLDFGTAEALLECHEAAAVFGSGNLSLACQLLPVGSELGSVVCFALDGGESGGPPGIVPSSLAAAGAAAARTAVLAGTVKAFSKRQSGERVGWITSAATQHTYNSDVYIHGSMLEGLSIGDAVSFTVHENARGQPQASIGSIVRLGSQVKAVDEQAADVGPPLCVEGMDAPAYAPGRVVYGVAVSQPADDLFESLLNQARQGAADSAEAAGGAAGAFAFQ